MLDSDDGSDVDLISDQVIRIGNADPVSESSGSVMQADSVSTLSLIIGHSREPIVDVDASS